MHTGHKENRDLLVSRAPLHGNLGSRGQLSKITAIPDEKNADFFPFSRLY